MSDERTGAPMTCAPVAIDSGSHDARPETPCAEVLCALRALAASCGASFIDADVQTEHDQVELRVCVGYPVAGRPGLIPRPLRLVLLSRKTPVAEPQLSAEAVGRWWASVEPATRSAVVTR